MGRLPYWVGIKINYKAIQTDRGMYYEVTKTIQQGKAGVLFLPYGCGEAVGVVFDVDTYVTYDCMRVLVDGGWKWQIVGITKLLKDPDTRHLPKADQEILDMVGMDMDEVDILIKIPQNVDSEEKFLNWIKE